MAKAEKGREKTNVMRTLEQAGIAYTPHWYDPEETKGTDTAVTRGGRGEGPATRAASSNFALCCAMCRIFDDCFPKYFIKGGLLIHSNPPAKSPHF